MKHKKGYAMAMVVVTMAVVMALSGLVLTLISSVNFNQKHETKNLERSLLVSEFSTAYANKNLENFVTYCEAKSWTKNVDESTTTLTSSDGAYSITISEQNQEETFNFVQTNPQKILAKVHKTDGEVDAWHYEIKE